jgi:hypothetical protein
MPKFSFDPDAQAFITAAAITDNTQKNAINTLVLDLKGYSIWTKFKAIYPFVGGTNAKHTWNLKNTAQFQITWSGGVTSSSNGIQLNGINSYGNTNLNTNSILSPNNLAISVYTNTNRASSSGIIYGNSDNTTTYIPIIQSYLRFSTNIFLSDLGNFNFRAQTTNTNTAGYYINTRTAANSSKSFKNNSLICQNTNTQTTNTLPNTNIYLGTFNYNNGLIVPSNVESIAVQFFTLSNGLTDTEAANFYTAVQAFQTTLGRQV